MARNGRIRGDFDPTPQMSAQNQPKMPNRLSGKAGAKIPNCLPDQSMISGAVADLFSFCKRSMGGRITELC